MDKVMKNLRQRIPWIANRDKLIKEQTLELRELRKELHRLDLRLTKSRNRSEILRDLLREAEDSIIRDSFGANIYRRRREYRAAFNLGTAADLALLQIPHKLLANSLALSHGVPVPEIYQVWESVDTIDLTTLPDSFVLKADGGTNSRAVFPLRRVSDDSYQSLRSGATVDTALVRRHVQRLKGKARPPYFAEELLSQGHGALVPDDIKVFTAHGDVIWVLLRRAGTPGDASTVTMRYVGEDGQDLGPISRGRKYDSTIPVPPDFESVVTHAKHLSRASGLDFCRVDMYSTTRGAVFGEMTVAPGGRPDYPTAQDRLGGIKWNLAQQRLAIDLAKGRPPGVIFGGHPHPWHYSASDTREAPDNWPRRTVDCRSWCA